MHNFSEHLLENPARYIYIYLAGYIYIRRQQERGLMQKARRLMDENSVSFQMFLILLSFITLGSETIFLSSSNVKITLRCLFVFLWGSMRRSQNLEIWRVFSVKKKLHKALRSVQFLASFISSYFEILSYLSCGEKIIRLASINRVELDEKSASDF